MMNFALKMMQGGLMILWLHGAGKYSVDEYMKKTD